MNVALWKCVSSRASASHRARPRLVASALVAVAIGGAAVVTSAQSPRVYYVSPAGNDTSAGTELLPLRTIQRAVDLVNPGDMVLVEDGVYVGTGAGTACASATSRPIVCLSRGGTASAWVTIRARNMLGAKISGQNNTSTDGFRFLAAANYIRIEGFDVYGIANAAQSASAFELYSGGHDVVITHNDIHHIGRLCTDTTNGQVGVYVQQPNVVVEANLIHDIGRFAPGENGCQPATTYYTNHDHGIYLNGGASGASIPGANAAFVSNNIFFNNLRGWPIQIYPGRLANLSILNNTFSGTNPYQDGQIILGADTTDARIVNNIFHNPRRSAINYYRGQQTNLRVTDNMVSNAAILSATPSGTLETHNLTADPLFVNAPSDFHLASASPAIAAGQTLPEVPVDIMSLPRTDRPYDLGAHRAGSGSGGTPLPPPPSAPPPSPTDTVPPVVAIASLEVLPSQRAILNVTATDNVAVAAVRFSFDGVLMGTDTEAPYSMTYIVKRVAAGPHLLTATAVDASGNTASASVTVVR